MIYNIDWEANGKAMKISKLSRQHWVAKFRSGWCATGEMMKRWDKSLVAMCPRCGQQSEDNDHILTCQAAGAVETWNSSVGKMQSWLDANSTCPDLTQLVISILKKIKSGQVMELHDDILYDGVKMCLMLNKK